MIKDDRISIAPVLSPPHIPGAGIETFDHLAPPRTYEQDILENMERPPGVRLLPELVSRRIVSAQATFFLFGCDDDSTDTHESR